MEKAGRISQILGWTTQLLQFMNEKRIFNWLCKAFLPGTLPPHPLKFSPTRHWGADSQTHPPSFLMWRDPVLGLILLLHYEDEKTKDLNDYWLKSKQI